MSKVTITTAVKLSPTQLKKLTEAIEKKYGKLSQVETNVEQNILGGVIVTIGSKQFDNSYRGRIQTLKEQIVTAISE